MDAKYFMPLSSLFYGSVVSELVIICHVSGQKPTNSLLIYEELFVVIMTAGHMTRVIGQMATNKMQGFALF